MGYYASLTDHNFVIPSENLDEAYRLLTELSLLDDLKSGSSWSGGKQIEKWFSWMPVNYPDMLHSTEEIFQELGFDTSSTEEGLYLTGYDSKTGQEDLFLSTIAHLVKDGSSLTWRGEDDEMWRFLFEDGKMITQFATITWF